MTGPATGRPTASTVFADLPGQEVVVEQLEKAAAE